MSNLPIDQADLIADPADYLKEKYVDPTFVDDEYSVYSSLDHFALDNNSDKSPVFDIFSNITVLFNNYTLFFDENRDVVKALRHSARRNTKASCFLPDIQKKIFKYAL